MRRAREPLVVQPSPQALREASHSSARELCTLRDHPNDVPPSLHCLRATLDNSSARSRSIVSGSAWATVGEIVPALSIECSVDLGKQLVFLHRQLLLVLLLALSLLPELNFAVSPWPLAH